jgi:hypothetical protein
MTIRSIDKQQRQAYFDRLTREMGATEAQIEIAGSGIGAQPESDWIRLMGVTYDPRSDSMEINTADLDHRIPHPREVYVDDSVEGLHSIEIVDMDDNRQIIRLRQPLKLPH